MVVCGKFWKRQSMLTNFGFGSFYYSSYWLGLPTDLTADHTKTVSEPNISASCMTCQISHHWISHYDDLLELHRISNNFGAYWITDSVDIYFLFSQASWCVLVTKATSFPVEAGSDTSRGFKMCSLFSLVIDDMRLGWASRGHEERETRDNESLKKEQEYEAGMSEICFLYKQRLNIPSPSYLWSRNQ